jgi:predicted AAA+ superfamily ATPase
LGVIARTSKAHAEALLLRFPAICMVGPRQCGKTTLAKMLGVHYFDLESPPDRGRLDVMWDSIMSGSEVAVFDEAQCWPDLFARLRGAIDARRSVNGRFILLGSISVDLMTQVGESLAGRMALMELTPFHAGELPPAEHDALWRFGGFPDGGVLEPAAYPKWQSSYLKLMAKRDLPQWGLAARPEQTERLFRLLAGMHGNPQNASELGAALGITHTTVQSYLDYLEGAFLIRRLPAYHAKIAKRLLRTPKVYWRDTGLLHDLLGMTARDDLLRMTWVGQSWEGWVLEQILAHRSSIGLDTQASYFRTSDGLECDLVLESEGKRELVEIKLTTAPSTQDLAKLRKIQSLIGADRLVLLSRSKDVVTNGATWMTDLRGYLAAVG